MVKKNVKKRIKRYTAIFLTNTETYYTAVIGNIKKLWHKKFIGSNSLDEKVTVELINSYIQSADYQKAEVLSKKLLKQNSSHLKAMELYARTSYEKGEWLISIKRYRKLQAKLVINKNRKAEKLWLNAHKKIIKAFLYLRDYNGVLEQRSIAFKMLNGKKDIIYLLSEDVEQYKQDKVKTEFFIKGLSGYYTCLHCLDARKNKIVEKCIKASSKEPQIYKLIDQYNLFGDSKYVAVPEFQGTIERDNYTKLFINFVEGTPLKEMSEELIDFYKLGMALGEVAKEFNSVDVERSNKRYNISDRFNAKKVAQIFKNNDYQAVQNNIYEIEKYLVQFKKIESIWNKIPKVFSHNDNGANNVFYLEKEKKYLLIDWERARFNAAGSDIGNVLRWKKFIEAEYNSQAEQIEAEMVDGYYSVISESGINISKEEIVFAYLYHFVNGKLIIAINKGDYELFGRIVERCKKLQSIAGYWQDI